MPFVRVNESVDVPPTAMVVGLNALSRLACTTVTSCGVTELVAPETVIDAALLVLAPSVVPRTVKVITHVWPVFTPTLEAPMVVDAFAVPVSVGETHPALALAAGGLATSRPAGSASLTEIPERFTGPDVLSMVKASVVVCPMPRFAAPNALVRMGSACTTSWAFTPAVVTLAAPEMFAAFVLLYVPAVAEVTFTRISQLATPAFIAAPVTVMDPGAVDTKAGLLSNAPPAGQFDCTFGAPATVTPAGNVSTKLIPDWAGLVPPLVTVKTSVEVPPRSMVEGEKTFARLPLARFTTRHWSVEPLVMPVVVTLVARLVKPAGLPTQLAFTCVAWFVRPATVTVQLAVPEVMVTPVMPDRTLVPAV